MYGCYTRMRKTALWASATNEGSLYLFNRQSDRFELFDKTSPTCNVLAEDREGGFWGGDYSTLLLIDRDGKKHRRYNIGYPVRCIHEDKKQNLWVGTQAGGLLLFDRKTGQYKRFTTDRRITRQYHTANARR